MELTIHSKTFGDQIVYFDSVDKNILSKYNWHLKKDDHTFYCVTNIFKKNGCKTSTSMHRLLMKAKINQQVDHKDGNGLNNKRNNLRFARSFENAKNKNIFVTNKIGYKGVSRSPGGYRVNIQVDGKQISGGKIFDDPIEAAKRYNELALIHHGEFAKLNEIPS